MVLTEGPSPARVHSFHDWPGCYESCNIYIMSLLWVGRSCASWLVQMVEQNAVQYTDKFIEQGLRPGAEVGSRTCIPDRST